MHSALLPPPPPAAAAAAARWLCRATPILPSAPALPDPAQVLAHYGTDPQRGLTASQVAEARRRHGRNELAPEPGGLEGVYTVRVGICKLCCSTSRSRLLARWCNGAHQACHGQRRAQQRLACTAHAAASSTSTHNARTGFAGTPFWKLVLKQFDDLLVKVGASVALMITSSSLWRVVRVGAGPPHAVGC